MGCLIISRPLVSVVIPAYQAERTIEKTLASVIEQDQHEWEIILIEDGSSDRTESICQEFQNKFSKEKIKYFRLPQCQGQANARNQGILKAQGEWIAFLDADDLWPRNYLSVMLLALEKENAPVGYCSMQCFDSKTETPGGLWGPTSDDLENFTQNLFLRNFINPSGTICRKTLFESHQFDPDPKIQSCEDHDLWLTLVSKGAKFIYVPEVKVLYRKNHAGAATGNRERMLLADIEVMKKQWDNPAFSNKTKKEGLSQNYGLLGEYYFSQGSLKAVEALMKSWFYQPLNFKRARRVLKVLALFCCRAFRSGKIVDSKV